MLDSVAWVVVVGEHVLGAVGASVRDFFRPARTGADASAKKFAQHTKNGPKWAFSGVLGEYFRENAARGAVLGEFFRGNRWTLSRNRPDASRVGDRCRVTGVAGFP